MSFNLDRIITKTLINIGICQSRLAAGKCSSNVAGKTRMYGMAIYISYLWIQMCFYSMCLLWKSTQSFIAIFLLSVKCASLHLIGVLCQYYPDEMKDQFERMVTLYLRKLQHEVTYFIRYLVILWHNMIMFIQFEKSSDLKIIEGSLKGLCCVLHNYKIDNKRQCEDMFKYTMKSMQPKTGVSRHAITIGT